MSMVTVLTFNSIEFYRIKVNLIRCEKFYENERRSNQVETESKVEDCQMIAAAESMVATGGSSHPHPIKEDGAH